MAVSSTTLSTDVTASDGSIKLASVSGLVPGTLLYVDREQIRIVWDGTAGANSTWTSAAVQGSSLTVVGISATKWNVQSVNLGTIAP